MSKKNKKKSRVPGERGSRRWLWIAIAVILVIVAAYAAWYLVRFEFNDDYKAFITEPEAKEEGTEFTPIEGENHVADFDLVAKNDTLELYAQKDTGMVAIYDLRNGQTVYSNPPAADDDKVANKTNRAYLKSQFFVNKTVFD